MPIVLPARFPGNSTVPMRILAPAKINLHLEVLGLRADGFHALETVFQTLALADELDVSIVPGSGIRLACSTPSLPSDARNLAWRAAAAVQVRRPNCGRIELVLTKRIPHGAGLGGGSSDAASVLLALNRQLLDPLTDPELAEIALELGSDVPFFLLGGTAHATGRGEILTRLPALPPTPVTVLMPAVSLPTPAVFQALTAEERGPRQAHGAPWAAAQTPIDLLHNRLTGAAERLAPAVSELLIWLARMGVPHLMSGSGAACFALAELADAPFPPGVTVYRTTTGPGAAESMVALGG
jgi:4-diphosphocytidyl-2-C-methyl-D-erythritol kinase